MADGLYDLDFYAWTKQQADLLRRREAASNTLDYERLAEEVESMGRSQERACESQVLNILLHFLKLQFVRDQTPARHWRSEIAAFRLELDRDLSPTLRVRVPESVSELYAGARKLFCLTFDAAELGDQPPQPCPWTWDDILGRGEDWTPQPVAG